MKRNSQSQKGTTLQSLLFPKIVTRIETWSVRTLHETGKSAQVAKEMDEHGVTEKS